MVHMPCMWWEIAITAERLGKCSEAMLWTTVAQALDNSAATTHGDATHGHALRQGTGKVLLAIHAAYIQSIFMSFLCTTCPA